MYLKRRGEGVDGARGKGEGERGEGRGGDGRRERGRGMRKRVKGRRRVGSWAQDHDSKLMPNNSPMLYPTPFVTRVLHNAISSFISTLVFYSVYSREGFF